MKTKNVRLGIVGVGNMGTSHARRVRRGDVPGLELVAVADKRPDRMKSFEDISTFTDPKELFHSGEGDAVLISTPHYDHTSLGIAALNAGLHVLVEKPISVHKADCQRLIEAYKPESDQVFAAMFNQRTDPRYCKLRQLIQNGTLGAIQRVNWVITSWFRTEHYYASGDWRATWAGEGGGVLLNQCPHQLDLWQWLFGMPSRVTAFCQMGRFHNIEVEDSVMAMLEYDSGVQGVFVTTTGEAPGINQLEVVGDMGTVAIGAGDDLLFRQTEVPVSQFSRESTVGFARPPVWDTVIPVQGKGEQHAGVMKNFVAAIQEGAELLAPAVEGIHSVELANSMLLSAFRGCTQAVPIDAGEYEVELKKKIAGSIFEKKTAETAPVGDLTQSF